MSDLLLNMSFSEDSTVPSRKTKKSGFRVKRNVKNGSKFAGRQNRWSQKTLRPNQEYFQGARSNKPSQSAQAEALIRRHMENNHFRKGANKNNTFPKQKFTSAGRPSCHPSSSRRPCSGVPSKCVAIDCEMVGAGAKGHLSLLARCSVVSYDGDVMYDKFIKPAMAVTNYRTRWSGIRARDLVNATPFHQARKEILKLLEGKVVIGHAIHNDFKCLQYSHPTALTRDTSCSPALNLKAGFQEKDIVSLKRLTKALFDRDIQVGRMGHSSVEDAQATMELYKAVEDEWEQRLAPRKP
ncbi:interferon-stimulated 20 kDa exonuclease-like 2 [Nerophis lumbriciformis]|uniref:interferon-stimulated 20 kDa exonuclease-like 2 n=1 Tax=Nerophis lumbriciformis TaxID=546530 RepID=UPI002ADF9FC4|nr:interferon-stimulated 20 kDa exonuclease-like 2 [Nerophis lumbriciformis]